jgi:hypothetical protein
MIEPIDANALKDRIDSAFTTYGECTYVKGIINAQPTIEADIDRAEIMRLCNEIEDIVSEISKLSENYLIYSDCKSILDRTKAIRNELTGDAEA